MWTRKYKDYPTDRALKQQRVETGKGIVGCEMHENFGWGHTYDLPKKRKAGFFTKLLRKWL